MELSDVKKILENQGFSSWEIEGYLTLLRHGPQTALELARLSKIARSKTYEVVTRLRKKGLVMKDPPMPSKDVTQKFIALNPKEVFSAKVSQMNDLSAYLSIMYENPKKVRYPQVQYYTSKEAVKNLFKKMASSQNLYLYIDDLSFKNLLGFSYENLIKDIVRKHPRVSLGEHIKKEEFAKDIPFLTHKKTKEGINIFITKDTVILDLWKTQHIMLEITSKETVETFKQNFF